MAVFGVDGREGRVKDVGFLHAIGTDLEAALPCRTLGHRRMCICTVILEVGALLYAASMKPITSRCCFCLEFLPDGLNGDEKLFDEGDDGEQICGDDADEVYEYDSEDLNGIDNGLKRVAKKIGECLLRFLARRSRRV